MKEFAAKEKAIFLRRIEYLCKLVLEPESIQAERGKTRKEKPIKSIRDIKRDEHGKPVFPIKAKGATIHDLGVVVYDRPNYHIKSYIYPVGFKSSRKMPSIKHPGEYIDYYSEILDGGSKPIFQV
jgi:hypothetical protein